MLVFVEGGKPDNPEKNPRSKDENQEQTQPTYDAESGNRTRATLVGCKCFYHCTIPAPLNDDDGDRNIHKVNLDSTYPTQALILQEKQHHRGTQGCHLEA